MKILKYKVKITEKKDGQFGKGAISIRQTFAETNQPFPPCHDKILTELLDVAHNALPSGADEVGGDSIGGRAVCVLHIGHALVNILQHH